MSPRLPHAALLSLACAALLELGCRAQPASDRSLPKREPYVALERDFQDFERWTKVQIAAPPATAGHHEGAGALEYINQLPERGAAAFPVGTILVKTVPSQAAKGETAGAAAAAPALGRDVFAMVKRGGGYNASGALGWEWLELRRRDDGSFGIVWRGIQPSSGHGYGESAASGCNDCHRKAVQNDYVQALALAP